LKELKLSEEDKEDASVAPGEAYFPFETFAVEVLWKGEASASGIR